MLKDSQALTDFIDHAVMQIVSYLMTLKLLDPTLYQWNPIPYGHSWIAKGSRSTDHIYCMPSTVRKIKIGKIDTSSFYKIGEKTLDLVNFKNCT